ncbi:arsenate reductase ArsC [Alteromonas sp. ASW11-19]|uniref:Arsenate reductase ArsC n=1 Tax=Alteromonas salexigens TaxID=2982530 RepID=A0ABT2VQ44_9ALTE|nr:arsenate reductase ArsC [Alteromonas salexigens]MCU7555438.1 arsenate reductase ArsC [Alteromonas salexigens]
MKILYICTHNRCRSILCEAISNQRAAGRIEARSAGSQPAGEVHPLSLRYLEEHGYVTDGLESQSWDAFEDFAPDLVITVCDAAAGEACPLYFTKSVKVHWGLADPSKSTGSEEQKAQAFAACIHEIEQRVDTLLGILDTTSDINQVATALKQSGAR